MKNNVPDTEHFKAGVKDTKRGAINKNGRARELAPYAELRV